jgi:hypothetical protein
MSNIFDIGLTLPRAIAHDSIAHVGTNIETARPTACHFFTFKKGDKKLQVRILADESLSRSQIEDMASQSLETWLKELEEEAQKKVGKHKPTPSERREVGLAIREFREHAAKRRESSNSRLYYPVG